MIGPDQDLVVLPPVADDPIFRELLTDDDDGPGASIHPHEFAALFIRHRWSFALHARRFLSDKRDIDEVVQEGFLRLFLALPELETELQALAFGRRTITNLCIDRYRSDQRRPRLVDLESIPMNALVDQDDETDPVIQAEDAAIVRDALALLSPLHREALIKREIEEKPLPQIAEELDIPVEQVKHLLHRARRSLRRLLVGTHVEPGVDLDLAMVLEANRLRAARVAKPAGALALALILVLAGFLGLRPDGSQRKIVDVAGPASQGGFLREPTPLSTSGHVAGPVTQRPGGTSSVPRAAGRPAATPHTPVVVPAPAASVPLAPRLPTQVVPPVTSVTPPPTHQPPPPPVVVPSTSSAFVVFGVGASDSARVSDQQRDIRSQGAVSTSTISALTTNGTYALRQAYTFAGDGSLTRVTLNEAVPLAGGDVVGTLVGTSSTSVYAAADGSVHLVTSGSARALGVVNGATVGPRQLTVDVVLAADRVSVVSERVVVTQDLTPEPLAVESLPPYPPPIFPPVAPEQSPVIRPGPEATLPSSGSRPARRARASLTGSPLGAYDVATNILAGEDDRGLIPASR